MSNKIIPCLLSLAVAALVSGKTHAEPYQHGDFFVRGGYGKVNFNSAADVKINGMTVSGGSLKAENNETLIIEGGYFFTDNFAVALTGGIPPVTKINGHGTLGSAGEVGKVKYAPIGLEIQWYPDVSRYIRPYIGAGVAYTFMLETQDSMLNNFDVDSAFSPVIQLGVEVPLSNQWSAFFDVKKIFLEPDARGEIGPAAAHARIKLDPTIFTLGFSRHF